MNGAIVASAERRVRVDPWLVSALFATAGGLAIALWLAVTHDLVFGFADTASHVVIPRRVFDNAEPGLAQLGTHWGPLFHVLQLPFVWFGPLYQTGASAIIVSVSASLATAFFLYRLALLVDAPRPVAFLAVLLLAANPNFLYSGVIPMLPATIMATTTANVYYLTRWALTGRGAFLLAAGLALTAATLTHFETWVLAPLELTIVVLASRKQSKTRYHVEATTLLWLLAGGYGIGLFLLMNLMIFGNLFAFTQAFSGTGDALGIGRHGLEALLDYPRAAWLMTGPVLGPLGLVGCILFVWRWRHDPRRLIPLLLLYPLVWYTLQAVTTGSLIFPAHELGDWRNLRYGTTMIPAAAFFAAVGIRVRYGVVLASLAVLVASIGALEHGRVATWEDARNDIPSSSRLASVADWFGARAGHSRTLIPVHHSLADRFELYSDLPTRSFIDASDSRVWRKARSESPVEFRKADIQWIVWVGDRGQRFVPQILERTGARLCRSVRSVLSTEPLVRIYSITRRCT